MALFLRVWIFLLVLTGIEVALAYVQASAALMLTLLLVLSLAKAVYIIAYFMHVKFERRLVRWVFFPVPVLLILSLLALLADSARAQCVMCQRTAQAQRAEQQRALNTGILILLAPALLGLGAVVHLARSRR